MAYQYGVASARCPKNESDKGKIFPCCVTRALFKGSATRLEIEMDPHVRALLLQ